MAIETQEKQNLAFRDFDEKLNDTYTLSDRSKVEDPKFYGGEPIWVTAEKQGVKTASYFFIPGLFTIIG